MWGQAEQLEISRFRTEGSGHRPRTFVRLLYDNRGIHGMFRVQDRYVRCVHTRFMDPVCKDSCVEFFIQPKISSGYFNFEFNCGGALCAGYIVDPGRTTDGFRDFRPLTDEEGRMVRVRSSLPCPVEPEIAAPIEWTLQFYVPFALIERRAGPLGGIAGSEWKANFFKCGDETSHPHWASWTPLPARNFHLPECFGSIRFAE